MDWSSIALEHGVGMELAGGGGDQDVVEVREVPARGEGLTKGGERVGDGTAGLLGEDGGAHGLERVGGPIVGPPDRQEPVLCRLVARSRACPHRACR